MFYVLAIFFSRGVLIGPPPSRTLTGTIAMLSGVSPATTIVTALAEQDV